MMAVFARFWYYILMCAAANGKNGFWLQNAEKSKGPEAAQNFMETRFGDILNVLVPV